MGNVLGVVIHTHMSGEDYLPFLCNDDADKPTQEQMIWVVRQWGSKFRPESDMLNFDGHYCIEALPQMPSAENPEGGNHE